MTVLNATLPTPRALPSLAQLTPLQRIYFGYLADYDGETLKIYELHLNRFLTWCQQLQLDALTIDRTHVALYVRHLADSGLRPSSINTAMTPVKGFFKWAMLEGYVDRDPVVHVRLPRSEYRQKYPLDREELRRVRAAAKELGGRHWALGELLTVHALRISEACGLRIENYQDTQRGHRVMTLRRKGGKTSTVPLPIAVVMALDDAAGDRTNGLVITRTDGGPLSRSGGSGLVRTIVRHAGINRAVNPHLLRSSAVTALLDGGGDIREAQRLADHEDPRTTSRHYDLGKRNHDTHPVHIASARLTV